MTYSCCRICEWARIDRSWLSLSAGTRCSWFTRPSWKKTFFSIDGRTIKVKAHWHKYISGPNFITSDNYLWSKKFTWLSPKVKGQRNTLSLEQKGKITGVSKGRGNGTNNSNFFWRYLTQSADNANPFRHVQGLLNKEYEHPEGNSKSVLYLKKTHRNWRKKRHSSVYLKCLLCHSIK